MSRMTIAVQGLTDVSHAEDSRAIRLGSHYFQLLQGLVTGRLHSWVVDRWLGFWWWLIEPLAMTATYLFMVTAAFGSQNRHPVLFLMCAILPWTWLVAGTRQALVSLAQNSRILSCMQVDYTVFPSAEVIASTIRFLFASLIIAGLMVFYQIPITVNLLWLAVLLVIQLLLTLGLGYWLALSQVYLEDTANAWQVVCRIWFFLSPSIYALEQVPASIQRWYLLNPMATLLSSYRHVIMNGQPPNLTYVTISSLVALALAGSGFMALRRAKGIIPLYL